MISSLSPFWAETTQPSAARCGRSGRGGACRVLRLDAEEHGLEGAGDALRQDGRAVTVAWAIGPVISQAALVQGRDMVGSRSTNSTSWPARMKAAPKLPPMAPAPQTRIG